MTRPDVNLKASLLGLLATVDLDLALIPRYGIEGAAVASATSYLVTTTFVAISLARIAGLPLLATLLPVLTTSRNLTNGLKSLLRQVCGPADRCRSQRAPSSNPEVAAPIWIAARPARP